MKKRFAIVLALLLCVLCVLGSSVWNVNRNLEKEAEKAREAQQTAEADAAAAKKEAIHVQFAGKSYSNDELLKIAKDVWVYDMGQKAADMKSVEIYVKPEESMAYFVVNGTENGSFMI